MNTATQATTALSVEQIEELRNEQDGLNERHAEQLKILNDANAVSATALQEIGEIEERRQKIESLLRGELDVQHEEEEAGEKVELMGNPAITFAVVVAQKVYGNRFEGKSFPSTPSVEQVTAAFARDEQQKEIAVRTEPTLRFVVVEDGDTLHYQPIVLDGAQEMPLETYKDRDVYNMTRERRVLASRELNENPDVRKELDHEDMTVYDLLSHGAAMQGKPIDQETWSMLTAKFKKDDTFVWGAGWRGGRSGRVGGRAGVVFQDGRLRFAVWGDVIP